MSTAIQAHGEHEKFAVSPNELTVGAVVVGLSAQLSSETVGTDSACTEPSSVSTTNSPSPSPSAASVGSNSAPPAFSKSADREALQMGADAIGSAPPTKSAPADDSLLPAGASGHHSETSSENASPDCSHSGKVRSPFPCRPPPRSRFVPNHDTHTTTFLVVLFLTISYARVSVNSRTPLLEFSTRPLCSVVCTVTLPSTPMQTSPRLLQSLSLID